LIEVDRQFEFRRLQNRQVCGLGAAPDAAGLPVRIGKADPVAHQTVGGSELAPFIDRPSTKPASFMPWRNPAGKGA
jgi:hypothetical protein